MSGHSKWSTIKHQKEAQDQKRGQAFTRLGRAIAVAVREGGSTDPESNFALRLAMDKAKAANMPKENIQRAIDRGAGKGSGGEELREAVYEILGPEQVGIIVETLTDNSNRTVSELKKIVDMAGGTMASPGALSYLFEKKGQILATGTGDPEEMMLSMIDLGAEDVNQVEGAVRILVAPEAMARMKDALIGAGFGVEEMKLIMKPKIPMKIEDQKTASKIQSLIDALDEHDDVQKIWSSVA